MKRSGRAMARTILVIVVLVIAETAWALFAAETGIDLLLFYAVLVGASAIFFVPGIAEMPRNAPGERQSPAAETN
jgi:hypothetical protein